MCEYLFCLSFFITTCLSCVHCACMMRTYTRFKRPGSEWEAAPHSHAERPAKRRRVSSFLRYKGKAKARDDSETPPPPRSSSTVPSSPSPNDSTSNVAPENETPPSSPPSLRSPKAKGSTRTIFDSPSKNRKISSQGSLRETSGNARNQPRLKKKSRLVQTQIDLGGNIHKKCRSCGMEYIPSNDEDAAQHKKFHVQNNNGISVSKAFMDAARSRKLAEVGEWQCVVAVARSDPRVLRNQAQEVLRIANTELGSINFEGNFLWSRQPMEDKRQRERISDGAGETEESPSQDPESSRGRGKRDRFKVYLLLRNKKCVGLCLAEGISKAHKVLKLDERTQILQDPQAKSSAIAVSKDVDPALLGISRIWTSTAHRNEGVATALLDCAAENFLYGMKIPKDRVAFSQPTESGGRLARQWFGTEYGWHVYVD